MKHVVKILSLVVAVSAIWTALLQAAIIPLSYTLLLPIYFVVSLGCYGLLMVGIGLMQFHTCPEEAVLLHHDIAEAKNYLSGNGIEENEACGKDLELAGGSLYDLDCSFTGCSYSAKPYRVGASSQFVDPRLQSYDNDEVLKAIKVAILCTSRVAADRPPMSAAVSMLEGQIPIEVEELAPDLLRLIAEIEAEYESQEITETQETRYSLSRKGKEKLLCDTFDIEAESSRAGGERMKMNMQNVIWLDSAGKMALSTFLWTCFFFSFCCTLYLVLKVVTRFDCVFSILSVDSGRLYLTC